MVARSNTSARWSQQVRERWTSVGHGWAAWEPLLLHNLSPVNPHLVCALDLKPGHRVLDFGCGLGEPALTIAPFVGERGSVLGVDLSTSMIAAARRRARAGRVRNVRFRIMDVARLPEKEGRFNAITARYGIMFPEDPEAVLKALHARLRPRGRIALAVWGKPSRNPYFRIMGEVARPLLQVPPPDPEQSPHAMRFARSGRLAKLLQRAGFRGVNQEGVETPFVFASPAQYAQMVSETSGTFSTMLPTMAAAKQRRVLDALMRAARPFVVDGTVRMPGHTWVVSGTR